MIAENPSNFSIFSREQLGMLQPQVNAPFRALELGAGTGLASLVLGKVLERIRSMDRQCEELILFETCRVPLVVDTVFATDFHPFTVGKETSESLAPDNKWPNDADGLCQSRPQTSNPVLDQTNLIRDRQQVLVNNANILTSATPSSTSSIAPQLDIPFDVIIGADIIYKHSHALWVCACVERFLRKPTRPSSQADEYTIQAPATAPPFLP
ncbi:hypothetical protein JB92DRAFT_3007808, partial [Gautieria morchelliformis]